MRCKVSPPNPCNKLTVRSPCGCKRKHLALETGPACPTTLCVRRAPHLLALPIGCTKGCANGSVAARPFELELTKSQWHLAMPTTALRLPREDASVTSDAAMSHVVKDPSRSASRGRPLRFPDLYLICVGMDFLSIHSCGLWERKHTNDYVLVISLTLDQTFFGCKKAASLSR